MFNFREFAARPGVRAAIHNLSWLGVDRGVRLVGGLLVSLWVTRYLGPSQFGAFSFALALVALAMPIAEVGLDQVVRRELLQDAAHTRNFLMATIWLRAGAATVCYLLVVGGVFLAHVGRIERDLTLILGLILFSPAGMTADLWLQASLRAKGSVVAQWWALLVFSGLRGALIFIGAGVAAFAWITVLESAATALLVWRAAARLGMPQGWIWPGRALLGRLMLTSLPLLLSGLMVVLYMRLDVVMLKLLAGEREAGIYAAAVRVSELGYFVPMALAASLLPALLRARAAGPEIYDRRVQSFYDLNTTIAYVLAGMTALLATPLAQYAYGVAFLEAAPVLRWHAWAGVFVFLGVARTQFLLNEDLRVFAFVATAAGAVVNIALNFWLIPRSGAVGAAQATLISYAVAAWLTSWCHPKVRHTAVMQSYALLIPFRGWRYFTR